MIDIRAIARTALADVPMPPGRQDIETDNLAAVLGAAVVEARAYDVPEEEIATQVRTTSDVHARGLALAYAPAEV